MCKKDPADVGRVESGEDRRPPLEEERNDIMIRPGCAALVDGIVVANPQADAVPPTPPNPLERLAQLVIFNDRLMDELVISRARIVAARSYLDRPGCNARFGSAHLERCRWKHSGILAQLRANRIEALDLLGEGGQTTARGSGEGIVTKN
jgi:hypothetical protein